jgi:MFS family permease
VAEKEPRGPGLWRRLGRNVIALAGVSLATDVSSEMTYPLLPLFLTTVLGASATTLGAIEGAAESTAALLKLASGWLSDRTRRRKPLVFAGYFLASATRPLIGLARSASHVLAIRLVDRIGKGIRTSPRDALIASSVDAGSRGRAFGFHRAADNLGAVIGPVIAWSLLRFVPGIDLRHVFFLTAIPAAIAIAILVLGVREVPEERGEAAGSAPARHDPALSPRSTAAVPDDRSRAAGTPSPQDSAPSPRSTAADGARPAAGSAAAASSGPGRRTRLGRRFWAFLAILFVFTLGNSSDAFLLLQASRLGVATALLPIIWAALNLVKALSNVPGGALSDRYGRRPLLIAGWLLYAAVYFLFGRAATQWHAWALFAIYGLYFGLTEGVEKALVADFVPADRRGAAFGWYNLALGAGALPASLLFGLLADRAGIATAFTLGAALALAAALGIAFVAPARRAG